MLLHLAIHQPDYYVHMLQAEGKVDSDEHREEYTTNLVPLLQAVPASARKQATDFLCHLLDPSTARRSSAAEALKHAFLSN